MKKRKIETMLEFEQLINYYLDNDLPFSLLEEEYDLSLRQRGLMLNRILDYSGTVEELQNNIDGEITDSYLNLPHSLEEKTPLSHDELMELFNERNELRTKIRMLQNRVDTRAYDEKLKAFSESEIEIAKDIHHRIDFEEVEIADKKSIEYYKDLYNKYLLFLREKNNYLNKSLENNQEYQDLIYKLSLINDELVYRNVKLANWVIRMYFKRMPFEMEEAEGYALEGLSKAINGFDVKRGIHFSSYAVTVIKRNIQRNFVNLVGIPWDKYLLGLNYKRFVQEYINATGVEKVSVEDLYNSNLFGLSLSELKKGEKYANIVTIPFTYLLSVDPLESKDKKNDMLKTMDDYSEYDNYDDEYNTKLNLATTSDEVSVFAENKVLEDILNNLLEVLPEDQKEIIRKRFGFDDGIYRSMDQVADALNISKDKVFRVEKKIQRFLRHPLQSKLLRDFYMEKEVYSENRASTYRGL